MECELPEENGLAAFSRWKDDQSKCNGLGFLRPGRILEIVGPAYSGRAEMSRKIVDLALTSSEEIELVLLDCAATTDEFSERVHHFKIFDQEELQTAVAMLPLIVYENPSVKLVGILEPNLSLTSTANSVLLGLPKLIQSYASLSCWMTLESNEPPSATSSVTTVDRVHVSQIPL